VEPITNASETSSVSGVESGHRIKLHENGVLAKITGCMDRHVMEATETILLPDSINTEEGFKLSKAWSPRTSA
jgi:hypothetical protein